MGNSVTPIGSGVGGSGGNKTDPITRLTAARFDGPQALYTEAVRLLSERPALPDDLAGLVDAGRRMSPRLDLLDCETVLQMADAIEALAAENARLAASEARCAEVKTMAWAKIETAPRGGEWFIARTERGTARVVHYADEYDRFPISHDSAIWETPPVEWIPLSRILSSLSLQTEAEVRAEAWAAAIEAAAVKCIPWSLACSEEISALTQPADVSAALDRIKAEAKAEGMREAARIAADHTPEKHGGAPLAAHVTGKSIELAICAAITEVRK